jgi:hypothetical protein
MCIRDRFLGHKKPKSYHKKYPVVDSKYNYL